MNEEIITKILNDYDIKNPSKLVKSAIQEFAFKYAQKLLLKTEEVAATDPITETHVRYLPLTKDRLRPHPPHPHSRL